MKKQQFGDNNKLKTSDFEQYEHLAYLNALTAENAQLAAALGNDYMVAPDVVIYRSLCEDDEINAGQCIVNDDMCKMSEEKMSNHVYKMNPACPHCGEEHIWWRRRIPLEYEEKLDAWYAEHPDVSDFEMFLMEAPVFVPQSFRCIICGKEFAYHMGIRAC